MFFALTACGGGSSSSNNTVGPTGPVLPAFSRYAIHASGSVYRVDNDNGRLTYLHTFNNGGFPFASGATLAIHPTGSTVYGSCDADLICQFSIAVDGKLTEMLPRVATGNDPRSTAIDPDGRYAYVANRGSDNLSRYQIEVDGRLTPLASPTISAGTTPVHITVDPNGQFVYVANFTATMGNNTISLYAIDPNDGTLSELSSSPLITYNTNLFDLVTTGSQL